MKRTLILLTMLWIVSCSKNKDEEGPVISISSPAENQTFSAGQSVNIVATVSDNEGLHEVKLFVTNNATGIEVLNFEQHVDASTSNLNKSFTAEAGITYKIRVEAEDHVGNSAAKQILIQGQ